MHIKILIALFLAFLLVIGCKDAGPAYTHGSVSSSGIPPVTKDEQYRKDFYSAFNQDGMTGLILYFSGFSWEDDTERHAVCNAVASGGWEYARTHLSQDRYQEFQGTLAHAGYPKVFPTGKQLFALGRDGYDNSAH